MKWFPLTLAYRRDTYTKVTGQDLQLEAEAGAFAIGPAPCVVGAGSCGEGCGGLRSILVARGPSLAWRQDAAPLGPARLGWKEDGQLEPARRSIWHTAGESGGKVEVVLRLPDGGGVFGVDELSKAGDTPFLAAPSVQPRSIEHVRVRSLSA